MLDSPPSTTRKLFSPVRANAGTGFPEPKNILSSFRTRRSVTAVYIFTFLFIFSTIIFVLHNPFMKDSSLRYKNIFQKRSQFPTLFSHFFPPNTTTTTTTTTTNSPDSNQSSKKTNGSSQKDSLTNGSRDSDNKDTRNTSTDDAQFSKKRKRFSRKARPPDGSSSIHDSNHKDNETQSSPKAQVSNKNDGFSGKPNPSKGGISSHDNKIKHKTDGKEPKSDANKKKNTKDDGTEESRIEENVMLSGFGQEKESDKWLEMMDNCDLFDGRWVKDGQLPYFEPGSCPFIDESFNCFLNGRRDNGYEKYRWQPYDCNIPRWNGTKMLQLLRGKRLVYVGDSLNRNMWESMVCMLHSSVENKSTVYEASHRKEFRTEGSYSFLFTDYNCSVEFFRSPFLVQEWEIPETNGTTKETLRLDLVQRSADLYETADVLVFNTGHWWTHEKTSAGKGYYQEGSHVYDELDGMEALRKGMTTWSNWIDAKVNPKKTMVFFRGYSSSHFSGGQWNSGGQCDGETEPIKNEKDLPHESHRVIMEKVEMVLKGMNTRVFYLNVTKMSEFRKDAHPSIYTKPNLTENERKAQLKYQDCSHWCLPGVPDTWNEIVFAQLLKKHKQNQQMQQMKNVAAATA